MLSQFEQPVGSCWELFLFILLQWDDKTFLVRSIKPIRTYVVVLSVAKKVSYRIYTPSLACVGGVFQDWQANTKARSADAAIVSTLAS